ncbi:MAG: hypothetical protein BECKG1743E_GA0114224_109541, partial [Candidatus Kentron sp. G]
FLYLYVGRYPRNNASRNILVLPPMTIQCQYHWLLSLRGGRVTPPHRDNFRQDTQKIFADEYYGLFGSGLTGG